MHYRIDKLDSTIVITVESLVGEREDLSVFHAEVLGHLSRGERCFLIDLRDTKRVNSFGVAALMEAVESVHRRRGDLRICGISRQVDNVLRFLNMKGRFETCGSRTEGLSALAEVALRRAG